MTNKRKTKKANKIEALELKEENKAPEVEEVIKEPEQEGHFASDVDRLEFKILTIEITGIEKDVKIFKQQIDILEREKTLTSMRVSDTNARLVYKKKDANQLLDSIAKKVGLTAKSVTVDTDTGEIKH
jgi:hypothetical protein